MTWYGKNRRDLPWRVPLHAPAGALPDPYSVLVSETMLQQTQVSTVVPYFNRFIQRLPTLASLARCRTQALLRLWQGLGYYSRARNLQATAKIVLERHDGQLPSAVGELLKLPGVGPYTAGAIASLAFDKRAAIVDGNVARVLCRLDAVRLDPRSPAARKLLWRRAEEILPHRHVGDFNSALMELGATVCRPRQPDCQRCPVRAHCEAMACGMAAQLPVRSAAGRRPIERRCILCIRSGRRYLIEQRPQQGRWAAMWQFITIDPGRQPVTSASIRRLLALNVTRPRKICAFRHDLTHRRYTFTVYSCETTTEGKATKPRSDRSTKQGRREWVTLAQLDKYPFPRPQLLAAKRLASLQQSARGPS